MPPLSGGKLELGKAPYRSGKLSTAAFVLKFKVFLWMIWMCSINRSLFFGSYRKYHIKWRKPKETKTPTCYYFSGFDWFQKCLFSGASNLMISTFPFKAHWMFKSSLCVGFGNVCLGVAVRKNATIGSLSPLKKPPPPVKKKQPTNTEIPPLTSPPWVVTAAPSHQCDCFTGVTVHMELSQCHHPLLDPTINHTHTHTHRYGKWHLETNCAYSLRIPQRMSVRNAFTAGQRNVCCSSRSL